MIFVYRQSNKYYAQFDPERCAQSVHEQGRGGRFRQCSRKGKYEGEHEGQTYRWCKQHLPENVGAKHKVWREKVNKEQEASKKRYARRAAEASFCEGISTEYLGAHRLVDILEEKL